MVDLARGKLGIFTSYMLIDWKDSPKEKLYPNVLFKKGPEGYFKYIELYFICEP